MIATAEAMSDRNQKSGILSGLPYEKKQGPKYLDHLPCPSQAH